MNVLLVEDDACLQKLMATFLFDRFEFKVAAVSGGNEAARLLNEGHQYDLVITDLEMPEGSGLGLLQMMEKAQINIPTIVYTGSPFQADQFNFPNCLEVVGKPNFERLDEVIMCFLQAQSAYFTPSKK